MTPEAAMIDVVAGAKAMHDVAHRADPTMMRALMAFDMAVDLVKAGDPPTAEDQIEIAMAAKAAAAEWRALADAVVRMALLLDRAGTALRVAQTAGQHGRAG